MFTDLKNWYLRNFVAVSNKPVSKKKVAHGIIDTHYQFGAVKGNPINSTGDYSNYIPSTEVQFDSKMDTMNCTCFGLSHVIETLDRVLWQLPAEYSPRYLGKMSGTSPQGNSMTNVLDNCRKICGMVNDSVWPFTQDMSWDTYYASIPQSIIMQGHQWIQQYNLNYSVVSNNKQAIAEALKYSPLYVCGYAWALGKNGYYQSWGQANHCFMLIGVDENGAYMVFDSYSPFIKKLDPTYLFGAVFSVTLAKNINYNLSNIQALIKRGLQYVLLVSPLPNFPAGVYKLNPLGITTQDVVKEINDEGVKSFEKQGKLVGISPTDFLKLLIT